MKKSEPRTLDEFEWMLQHLMIAFYSVPLESRIKALRAMAKRCQRNIEQDRAREVREHACNDPVAGGA